MVGGNHRGSIGLADDRRHLQRFCRCCTWETTNAGGLQTHHNGLSIFELGTLEGLEGNYLPIPSLLLLCKIPFLWLSLARIMLCVDSRTILSISLPFTWNIAYCSI